MAEELDYQGSRNKTPCQSLTTGGGTNYQIGMLEQLYQFQFPNNQFLQSVEAGRQHLMGFTTCGEDMQFRQSLGPAHVDGSQGACGSLQGLLRSFCTGQNGVPMYQLDNDYKMTQINASRGYPLEGYGSGQGATLSAMGGRTSPFDPDIVSGRDVIICSESPPRINVDDSGYESSGSSVYDVPSDDDDCNVFETNDKKNSEEDVEDQEQDVQEPNAVAGVDEHMQQSEKLNDDAPVHVLNSGNTEGQTTAAGHECPCMHDKPFIHVMADGYGEIDTEPRNKPWKRRNRQKSVGVSQNCRVSKGMGPIEIALRNAPYRKTEFIFEPLVGLTFDSDKEAYDFYNMYSWEVGFGIKYGNSPKNNKRGYYTGRDLRCLCSGTGETAKYKTKKTNCKAMVRLLRTSDDGWFISEHIKEHNHPLTKSCGQKQEWFSHGKLDPCAIDMIKYLRENKVSLSKVQCIMGSMFGSMENIPVSKRNLRAICSRIARDQMDDDVHKTLDVFRQIREQDAGFQFSVEPGEKNEINSLLWLNGKSREQYKCFGDVICFDTTYCTNIYKMPFGLFVGVNNHFQTTVFGGVFMKQENTESFSWVFREFASLMGGKEPQTVFTDQCSAMAAALKVTWLHTVHLLCKWHLFKDARSKFGAKYKKGSPFRKLFHRIINDMMTVDEFERAWAYMVAKYELADNSYLENVYLKRKMWAKPFLKNIFCARIASTQRSESANHMLKRYVPRNCSMNRFVLQFNKLLFDRNREEDRAEFDTTIVNDVRLRAWPIEKHAQKVYTAAVYALFRKEVSKSTFYIAVEKIGQSEFDIVHVRPDRKLPWGRDKFTVKVNALDGIFDCEFGLYDHFGVLCCHAIRVLVQIGVYEIPKAYINKRWTRSARDILPQRSKQYQKETLCMQSMTFRHSFLYVNAIDLVQHGNKDLGAFDIASKYLKKAQKKIKEYFASKGGNSNSLDPGKTANKRSSFPSDSDNINESASELEETPANTYGASGSSAWMSDSELLKLKAPSYKRSSGRPKELRYKGSSDYFRSGVKRNWWEGNEYFEEARGNGKTTNKRRKVSRCKDCGILGHTKSQCRKKYVDANTELPEN